MSIATEIQRLNTAKNNLRTSIIAKGVEVPVNSTLDTYSNYVDQISAGGGGYTVNLTGENCTLIGAGTYAEGSSVSIYCIPTSGYKLTSWSDGNTENPRTLTNSIDQNYTITANIDVDYSQEYFFVEDLSGSSNTLQISKNSSSAPTLTIYYSTDKETWTSLGSTSTSNLTRTIPANGKVYLRCTTNGWCSTSDFSYYNKITCTGNYKVGGNSMSLLYGSSFKEKVTLKDVRSFVKLFYNSSTLTNASNLVLPATTLTDYCYYYMFYNCSSLTTPPSLPATTLATSCYSYMFNSCNNLTTAPSLPATTLATSCYSCMFRGCSLTTAPELPATTLTTSCYNEMFRNCTRLNYIKCLATYIDVASCTYDWVSNVASSGTFIKNDNMTSWTTGTRGIPSGWTVINESDARTVTLTGDNCTFSGDGIYSVGSTATIKCTPKSGYTFTSWSDGNTDNPRTITVNDNITLEVTVERDERYDEYFYLEDVSGSSNSFSIIHNSGSDNITVYYSTDKSTWTKSKNGSIPANGKVYLKCTTTKWGNSGYNHINCSGKYKVGGNIMSLLYGDNFIGRTALKGDYSFYCLFYQSYTLTDASDLILPSTNLSTYWSCYSNMFFKCSSLTTAPDLPAATLSGDNGCYGNMFYGCSKLNYIKCLSNPRGSYNYSSQWVSGVASSGTFVKASGSTWSTQYNSGIPSGWTVEEV